LNYRDVFFTLTALPVFFLPGDFSAIDSITGKTYPILMFASAMMILLLLPYCVALILGGSGGPFIYYRF
jgi:hypothetical protein